MVSTWDTWHIYDAVGLLLLCAYIGVRISRKKKQNSKVNK